MAGVSPKPHWGSLQCSPRPLSCIWGAYFKKEVKGENRGRERGDEGGERRERGRCERERRKVSSSFALGKKRKVISRRCLLHRTPQAFAYNAQAIIQSCHQVSQSRSRLTYLWWDEVVYVAGLPETVTGRSNAVGVSQLAVDSDTLLAEILRQHLRHLPCHKHGRLVLQRYSRPGQVPPQSEFLGQVE